MYPVVHQFYQSEVNNEYVIRGNSAILKCSIPSFVADFVSVLSWHDETGTTFAIMDDSKASQSNTIIIQLLIMYSFKDPKKKSFHRSRFNFSFKLKIA